MLVFTSKRCAEGKSQCLGGIFRPGTDKYVSSLQQLSKLKR